MVKICLIGDSITQGFGSTGFINYSIAEKANVPAFVDNESQYDFHMEEVAQIIAKVAKETNVTFISLYDL